jgi:hypothetical protein
MHYWLAGWDHPLAKRFGEESQCIHELPEHECSKDLRTPQIPRCSSQSVPDAAGQSFVEPEIFSHCSGAPYSSLFFVGKSTPSVAKMYSEKFA